LLWCVIEACPPSNELLDILDVLWWRGEADCAKSEKFSDYCL
jgi:hypothetical protein